MIPNIASTAFDLDALGLDDLGVDAPAEEPQAVDLNANLAVDIPAEKLAQIADRAAQGYEADDRSMVEWRKRADRAMDLARMVEKGGQWPFEGCSDLVMPLVAQAAIQFAARAYPAIINDSKPVKARTLGATALSSSLAGAMPPMPEMPASGPEMGPPGADMGGMPPSMPGMPQEMPPMAAPAPGGMPGGLPPALSLPPMGAPFGGAGASGDVSPLGAPAGGAIQGPGGSVDEGAKQRSADRQADFMSWQVLEEMPEWEAEVDLLLHILPVIGSAWKKVWFDPAVGRNRSDLVHPSKVVVNNGVHSVERLPRISVEFDLYPWDIEERMRDGRWSRVVLDRGADEENEGDDTEDAPLTFIEQLTRIDLDDDGYAEPVVVVYHKSSRQIVRIANDYQPEDVHRGPDGEIHKIERFSQYILFNFLPDPAGGLLGMGFGLLLESIARATNGITNILIDSGILGNAGGGFIRKSARIPAKQVNGGLNKWFVTDIPDGVDPFVPFPRPSPDATLFNMLGMLQNSAKELTSTTDMMMGDLTKNVAPTTALAMIEQGTKVFNAVYKRIYRSLKLEYKALARLNFLFLNPETLFEWNDSAGSVSPEDFNPRTLDVVPAADPNTVSDMTENARVGALQMFMGDPLIDQVKLRKRMLSAMKVDAEDMMAPPPPPPQPDPQMQIETAKLEIEQQRLQMEQMRMQIEMQMRQQELQIKQMEAQIKAQVAMKPDAAPAPQMPEPVDPLAQAKAFEVMTKAEIDRMMAPLQAQKTQAETELTEAKTVSEMAKVQQASASTQLQREKIDFDAARAMRQEDRSDRQESREAKQPQGGADKSNRGKK